MTTKRSTGKTAAKRTAAKTPAKPAAKAPAAKKTTKAPAAKKTTKAPAAKKAAKAAAAKRVTQTRSARAPAAKQPAKAPAAKQPAKPPAKKTAKSPRARRPRVDPLRELAWDVDCSFDADDPTPAVQIEFVDGYLATAEDRGLVVDLDAALAYCAEVLGLDPGELRATWDGHARRLVAARGASGQAGELEALVALCADAGRHGETLLDDAAQALRAAWPRLGPALGRRLFTDSRDLRLRNAGPFTTLAGFEAARDARWLELQVTADCDLTPLAALTRLETLHLVGKREGLGVLARLPRLKQLNTEANVTGLAELARLPTLRVLYLIVAEDVSIAGLVDLKRLNFLTLLAGSRPLDDVTADTIAALARKRSRVIRLAEHEGWPLQLALPYRRCPGYVDINYGY